MKLCQIYGLHTIVHRILKFYLHFVCCFLFVVLFDRSCAYNERRVGYFELTEELLWHNRDTRGTGDTTVNLSSSSSNKSGSESGGATTVEGQGQDTGGSGAFVWIICLLFSFYSVVIVWSEAEYRVALF